MGYFTDSEIADYTTLLTSSYDRRAAHNSIQRVRDDYGSWNESEVVVDEFDCRFSNKADEMGNEVVVASEYEGIAGYFIYFMNNTDGDPVRLDLEDVLEIKRITDWDNGTIQPIKYQVIANPPTASFMPEQVAFVRTLKT